MVKKVGIISFHASHNYGSMLLAYALQTFLQRQGFDVKIINYCSFAQQALYPKPKRLNVEDWLLGPKLFVQNRSKWKKFEEFMRKHYSLTRMCSSLHQLEEVIAEEHFDAIITGGDQIWNMDCWDFSPAYYLPFETPGARRISYAPSFGGMHYWKPQHYGDTLKGLLDNYDYVSVRERDAAVFLTELLGREIPSVADPVFLLDRQDYEGMAGSDAIVKGDYLFYYSPWQLKTFSSYINDYAVEQGLKVVVSNGGKMAGNKWHYFNNCGPIEFLNLLRHAKMVVGESFHLAVFSMILHKPFYVVTANEESRMGGLLKIAGLSSRYVFADKGFPRNEEKIEWDNVDAYIVDERKKSLGFLTGALDIEKSI